MEKNREVWVDDVKVIACVLVVLGHFFQSMTKAKIYQLMIYINGLIRQSIISMFHCFSFVAVTYIRCIAV